MRSPVRGIVKGLKLHTVGGVVAPGEVLLEIVPMDEELIVETRISPYDIGHVQVNQPAKVKVIAYDFARYGAISGVLKSISASTFRDDDGVPFYKGIIDLDKNHLGDDPDTNLVLPGMTVQADINTGEKSILQYLLKPIYVSASQAFRER